MVIYKTTNLINGKFYIGKNKNNNNWYLGSGKLLLYAIKKYGKENFKKEIIEVCNSLEHMSEREIYWIDKLNSRDRNIGYNIQIGGDGGDNYKNLAPEQLIEVKKKISEGVKRSIANGKKCVGFTSKTAIIAARKLNEKNKLDNFESFKNKQNQTKLKNGTHPGTEFMKKKNSEAVKNFYKNNPEVKIKIGFEVSKRTKGKSKLSIFVKKYGEVEGNKRFIEFKNKLREKRLGKTPWNKGIKQKDYETKK